MSKRITFLKIGNSRLTAMRGRQKVYAASSRQGLKSLKEFLRGQIIFASVVPSLTRELEKIFRSAIEIKVSDFPMKMPYTKGLGVDRALNVFGAMNLYRGNLVVVDFGTATTVEFVSRQKKYLGGWILPGTQLMLESLARGTAALPPLKESSKPSLREGVSTATCMERGVLAAQSGIVTSALKLMRHKSKSRVTLIVTGGGWLRYKSLLGPGVKVEPDLIFEGMKRLATIKGWSLR